MTGEPLEGLILPQMDSNPPKDKLTQTAKDALRAFRRTHPVVKDQGTPDHPVKAVLEGSYTSLLIDPETEELTIQSGGRRDCDATLLVTFKPDGKIVTTLNHFDPTDESQEDHQIVIDRLKAQHGEGTSIGIVLSGTQPADANGSYKNNRVYKAVQSFFGDNREPDYVYIPAKSIPLGKDLKKYQLVFSTRRQPSGGSVQTISIPGISSDGQQDIIRTISPKTVSSVVQTPPKVINFPN